MKLLLSLFLVAFFQTALFGQKPWITLYDQGSYTLDARGDTDAIDIPLVLDEKVNFKKVRLADSAAMYVRLDKSYKGRYKDAFSISKNGELLPSIRIVADLRRLVDAGTYQLVLSFTAPNHPLCQVTLSLVRPAATLDTVNAIRVYLDGSETRSDPFAVIETGGRSRVQALTLSPAVVPGFAEEDIIDFSPSGAAVKAGGVAQIRYRLNERYRDRLPYGKTVGKVRITAPELSGPLTVPIEIQKKMWKGWLLVVLFGGILLGAFVRHFLKNRQALEAARVKGHALIDQIEAEMAKVGDKEFKDTMNASIKKLTAYLEANPFPMGSNPEENIAGAIQKTADDYAGSKKKLEDKMRETGEDIKALSGCFEGSLLTPVVRQQLEPAADDYREAKAALVAIDPTDAETRLGAAVGIIRNFLADYLNHANTQVVNLDLGNFLPGFVSGGIKKQVQGNIGLAKAKLAQVRKGMIGSKDVKGVADNVGLVDEVQANLERTLAYAVEIVEGLVHSHYKNDGSAGMIKLMEAFTEWKTVVEKAGEYPYQPVDLQYARHLEAAWTGAKGVARPLRAVSGVAKKTAVAADADDVVGELPWENKSLSFGGALLAIWGVGMGNIDSSYRRSMKNWLLYTAVQVTILSLLLCLGAYKIYAPGFVGTWDELITIFFFGFSLDITTDSVLQLKDTKG